MSCLTDMCEMEMKKPPKISWKLVEIGRIDIYTVNCLPIASLLLASIGYTF